VAYGLLEWLAEFYAGFRGELAEMVARLDDGSIVEGKESLLRHPVQVVLKLSGLGMLAFFREEEGCHLWTSLLAGSDVVRVRALPAPPERSARDVIDEHLAATARFEASLDRGEPAPDPSALLPAIRKIRYEPPLRPESTAIEIEDYRMGLVEQYNAPSLAEALATLSFYRMSRTR
jgi:ATP-dependent Clp protease ATP-binding subunit ClpC